MTTYEAPGLECPSPTEVSYFSVTTCFKPTATLVKIENKKKKRNYIPYEKTTLTQRGFCPGHGVHFTVLVYKYVEDNWVKVGDVGVASWEVENDDRVELYIKTINNISIPYITYLDADEVIKVFKFN